MVWAEHGTAIAEIVSTNAKVRMFVVHECRRSEVSRTSESGHYSPAGVMIAERCDKVSRKDENFFEGPRRCRTTSGARRGRILDAAVAQEFEGSVLAGDRSAPA